MPDALEFLNSHASVRHFTDQDISTEDATLICTTAERSPTSSNLHAYSIITVREQATKKTLAALCGDQDHVVDCPLFLVFCADLYRLSVLARERGYPFNGDTVEMLIVATVDAALAGGRALIAAQALGMGGVMVGGIRNQPDEVCRLLGLPNLVYPVMGMSLGYPARPPRVKPRLPLEGLCFDERYRSEGIKPAVATYDQTLKDLGYLRGREVEPEKYPDFDGEYSWSEHSARRMASEAPGAVRLYMKAFLQERGLMKR
jgi:nitroreductase